MIIGISGKSGSGKSLICRQLENMGAYVIDADVIGKNIMCGSVLDEVKSAFPDCFEHGELDRKKLASVVFNDDNKLTVLNSITHPAIKREIENKIKSAANDFRYIIVDAAVMVEAGMRDLFDFTVAVVAHDQVRKDRIIERDNISSELADARISAQNPDSFYIENTDFYVTNNGDCSVMDIAENIIERSRMHEEKHS